MSDVSNEYKYRGKATNEVLKRVKRLRNQIVESILDNNPFDVDLVCPKPEKRKIESQSDLEHQTEGSFFRSSTNPSTNILESYSKVDVSERTKESHVCLPVDLFCDCNICENYNRHCFQLKSSPKISVVSNVITSKTEQLSSENHFAKEITKTIQDSYRANVSKYLKYIDCVKIIVHSLFLNQDGIRKLNNQLATKGNIVYNRATTYFVEYHIPKVLLKSSTDVKSKVDTRFDSSIVRICSKKLEEEEVTFKQSHVHDVVNLSELNLKDIDIKFKISSRSAKQRASTVLGYANFNFSLLEISKNLSSHQDLSIESDIPLDLGFLNVSVLLGCGRLYFGKEFIDAIKNTAKDTHVVYGSDNDSLKENEPVQNLIDKSKNHSDKRTFKERVEKDLDFKKDIKQQQKKNLTETRVEPVTKNNCIISTLTNKHISKPKKRVNNDFIKKGEGVLLYGLVYISEVQYLLSDPLNSYLVCYPFAQEDKITSRTVYRSLHPVFNFYQKLPFLLQDDFLLSLRNNFMVVEFWQRNGEESLIGTAKFSLHQLFICYKQADIFKQLINNQYPVVTADWWEPIYSHPENIVKGHVKALVALGTEKQISNLEIERVLNNHILPNNLFLDYNQPSHSEEKQCTNNLRQNRLNETYDIVKAVLPKKQKIEKECYSAINKCSNCSLKANKEIGITGEVKKSSSIGINTDPQKIDVSVQAEFLKMDVNKEGQVNRTKQMLGEFFQKLLDQRANVSKETSTNTEEVGKISDFSGSQDKAIPQVNRSQLQPQSNSSAYFDEVEKLNNVYKNTTNLHLRRTSDLLDSLQQALKVDMIPDTTDKNVPITEKQNVDYFKAYIVIEEALHLPNRKKCRSRKNKKKSSNSEDALPSHYVTFEAEPNSELKLTHIEFKTTNPRWDFRCEISLPSDLLINNQKRLIFKVWRKCNNHSVQQNLHTDVVVGFAALDLTVLSAGLPSVQGWFNVIDFSGKCNGQIKICVTPLESISHFTKTQSFGSLNTETFSQTRQLNYLDVFAMPKSSKVPAQESGELLSNALKRKFQELEEINQRLRSRLANVIQEDSDSNDDFSEAFESDINMLCVEDDFDTINFDTLEKQKRCKTKKLLQMEDNEKERENNSKPLLPEKNIPSRDVKHTSCQSSTQLLVDIKGECDSFDHTRKLNNSEGKELKGLLQENLDQQLLQGKKRVDDLLQKISLLSGNNSFPISQSSNSNSELPFSSRYVSGCSVSQISDLQANADVGFKNTNSVDYPLDTKFEKFCNLSENSSSSCLGQIGSDQSPITTARESASDLNRAAPDGAGSSSGALKAKI